MNTIDVRYIPPEKWYHTANWELLSDYVSPTGVFVPKGFVSDGASVPLLARWMISPTGKIFPAAIVHDYMLQIGCDWDMCNEAFDRELRHINISKFKHKMLLSAVRLYAYFDERF